MIISRIRRILPYILITVVTAAAITAVFFLAVKQEVKALDENGLMPTPPMGFNTWYTYTDNFDENTIKTVANALVIRGLSDLGYKYIQIDWGWCVNGRGYDTRDEDGNLLPDPNKFPSGMKALADYLHGKGLKIGFYTDLGTEGCGNQEGSYGHYQQDVNTFVSWGADFIKVDSCGGYVDYANHEAAYRAFGECIANASDSVAFGICCGGGYGVTEFGPLVGNYYRTSSVQSQLVQV